MDTSLQQALHQSGSEILSSKLEPSCYASAMAEAGGNPTLAMGIYAQKRAQLLLKKTQAAHQRDKQRLAAMQLIQNSSTAGKSPRNPGLSILLSLTLFIGALSATMAIYAAAVGKISGQNLIQFIMIALIASGCCLSLTGWILHLFPRLQFVKIMLLFTTLAASASLSASVYLVKKSASIEWLG